MDPPWPNKSGLWKKKTSTIHQELLGRKHHALPNSPFTLFFLIVHRSSHYETQDIYDLYQIPLTSLVHTNSLVAVWITNKPKYRRFVVDKLFKSWHVDCIGEWTWLKVTDDGEPVFPLNSTHRKPYEQLIIGRYHGGASNNSMGEQSQSVPKPIPYQHSLISVPSKRHSRKPPLQGLLIWNYEMEGGGCLIWKSSFTHLFFFFLLLI